MSWKEVCVVLLFSHWALTRKPWTSCSVKKCGRSTYVWSTLEFSARMNSISPWLGLIYHKDIEPFLRVAYSSCRLYFSHYANSQYFSFFCLSSVSHPYIFLVVSLASWKLSAFFSVTVWASLRWTYKAYMLFSGSFLTLPWCCKWWVRAKMLCSTTSLKIPSGNVEKVYVRHKCLWLDKDSTMKIPHMCKYP